MDLETLIAKQEITDVVYRYARGIDRLDFELVKSCYHPDAYDDHGAFKGSVDEFVEATAETEGKDDVFGIRYVDRFEKRDDRWLIAHRVVATEWRRVDPVPASGSRGAVGVWGTRDGNDVIDWIMDAQGATA